MISAPGFLRHIEACNRWEPHRFLPLLIAGQQVGMLTHPFAARLAERWPQDFSLDREAMTLCDYAGFEQTSNLFNRVCAELVANGDLQTPIGEPYPITASGRQDAVATIDRVAASLFGLRAFGQHLNGYVNKSDGLYLWIATRAADRRIFPNALDNMVAGGLPYGISLLNNLDKECQEEAAVPLELSRQAVATGALSYTCATPKGLKQDTLYCYDLCLPKAFTPVNRDGEVAKFELMPVMEVAEMVRSSDRFKLNCNLVIIDFLIRHGMIDGDHPEYLQLSRGLHG